MKPPICVKFGCDSAPLEFLEVGAERQTDNGFLIVKAAGWYCLKCMGGYGGERILPAEPDPVRLCLDELRDVLRKHDMAGMLFVIAPPIGELGYAFDTTWSCARMEGRNFQLDGGGEELQKTLTAVAAMNQVALSAVEDTSDMLELIGTHRPFGYRAEVGGTDTAP